MKRISTITLAALLAAVLFVGAADAGYDTWSAEGGPLGGRIHVLLSLPDSPREIFAGTERGGIYYSSGDGLGWQPRNHTIGFTDVLALTSAPGDSDSLYAGLAGGGVYRSGNRGDSWFPVNNGLTSLTVRDLLFRSGGGRLFAATASGGIFYTDDWGANWLPSNTGLTELSVTSLDWAQSLSNRWYAGTDNGVFRSNNGGSTWIHVSAGLTTAAVTDVIVDPLDPDIVYAATFGGGVYRSTNGGGSWVPRSSGMGNVAVNQLVHGPSSLHLWAATREGMFGTTDGGASWIPSNAALPDTLCESAVLVGDSLFSGGHWGGVHCALTSTPGWVARNDGLSHRFVWETVPSPHDPGEVWAATYGGLVVTADTGWTWTASSAGIDVYDLRSVAFDPATPGVMLAGAFYGGIHGSTDGGATWAPSNTGIGAAATVTAVRYRAGGSSEVLAGTYSGPYKSSDGGATWTLSGSGMGNHKVWGLATTEADPTLVYAGTYGDGLYRSTDFGASWTAMPLSENFIRAVVIDPANTSIVYAGGYYQDSGQGGIYKSTDGGGSWVSMNNGLGDKSVWCVAMDPDDSNHLLTGTADGVFESFNAGGLWTDLSDGLTSNEVHWLAFAEDRWIAATYGGSSPWRETAIVSIDEGGPPSASVRLVARPNPFNPVSTLEAELPDGISTLSIYGPSGRFVRRVFEGFSHGGKLRAKWDGTDESGVPVASGLYFAVLESDAGRGTTRLVLIR